MPDGYKDFLIQFTKVAQGRITNFSPVPDLLENARKAESYIERVEYFLDTIECEDAKFKKNILIYSGGQDFAHIDSLYIDGDQTDDYKKFKAKLERYFNISKLRDTTRIEFHQAVQSSSESINEFYFRLDKLWKDTGYKTTADSTSKEDFLADRLVAGIRSESIRKRLLEEDSRTLKKVLDISNAFAAAQSQVLSQRTAQVSKTWTVTNSKSGCGYCGGSSKHKKEKCPAFGKKCVSCGKANHFASVCRSSKYPNKDRGQKNNKFLKKSFSQVTRTNAVTNDAPLDSHDQNTLAAVVNSISTRDI